MGMLTEWINEHDFEGSLKGSDECFPYPPCTDRAAWEAIDGGIREKRIQAAEQWHGKEFPSLSATAFMEFVRSGNRQVFERPHFARRFALADLVVGECLEDQGRFVDDIINGIWCICEESFWGVPAHNWAVGYRGEPLPTVENPYIDLFAAETASLLAWVRYLVGPKLEAVTHLIVRRIDIELQKRIIKPFLEHEDFFWMGFDPRDVVNNWNAWIIANLTGMFLLTEYDSYERIRGLKKLMLCLDRFLDIYPEDGGCDEGTSYWLSAGGSLFDTLFQMDQATGGKMCFADNQKVAEIGRFLYRSHISEQYFINFADGAAIVNIDRDMVYRYGKYIKDEKMMGLARSIDADFGKVDIPHALRRRIPAIFQYKEFMEFTGKPPCEKDVWMPDIQVMAAREHEGSDKGLYLAAKAGHNGENHNHNDVGSCIVFLDGQPGLIDVGVGTYTRQTFSEERYSIWTMQSRYHTLPTINGQIQHPGREYTASKVTYEADAAGVAFGLEMKDAYPAEAGIVEYRRTYTFMRAQEALLRIKDAYCFAGEGNTTELHFMCWKEPRIAGDGRIVIPVTGERGLMLAYPEDCETEIEFRDTMDERLNPVWGDGGVYRITLKFSCAGTEGSAEVVLSQMSMK